MKIEAISATETGPRTTNEDRFVVDDALGFYAVADGMGGHQRGALAAQLALKATRDAFAARMTRASATSDKGALLKASIEFAARAVYDRASSDISAAGMGTTLTAVVVEGETLWLGHVGDSRAYLIHEARVRQLTSDHTMVGDLLRAGALTPGEAKEHKLRHVLSRAVGPQPSVAVETLTIKLVPGDRILLATDGAFEVIDNGELAEASEEGPMAILDLARRRGTTDNATVIVIDAQTADEPKSSVDLSLREVVLGAMARSVFRDLSFPQRVELLNEGSIVVVEDDAVFIDAGDEIDAAYLVASGAGTLSVGEKEATQLRVGDMLGVLALVRERQAFGRVVGRDALTLLKLKKSSLEQLIQRRPWLGVKIYLTVAELASEAQERALASVPDTARLAARSPPWDLV